MRACIGACVCMYVALGFAAAVEVYAHTALVSKCNSSNRLLYVARNEIKNGEMVNIGHWMLNMTFYEVTVVLIYLLMLTEWLLAKRCCMNSERSVQLPVKSGVHRVWRSVNKFLMTCIVYEHWLLMKCIDIKKGIIKQQFIEGDGKYFTIEIEK